MHLLPWLQIEEAEMEAALKKKGSSKSQGSLAAAEEVRGLVQRMQQQPQHQQQLVVRAAV
jgi:hypothetical protein